MGNLHTGRLAGVEQRLVLARFHIHDFVNSQKEA